MSSAEIIQSKTAENSRISGEKKLELETHHSGIIFCDMVSPDEWESSLPLVPYQADSCKMSKSPSPTNSLDNLVLELEGKDMESLFLDDQVSSAPKSEDLLCMVPGLSDMLCEDIVDNEQDFEDTSQIQEKGELDIAEGLSTNSKLCRIKYSVPEEYCMQTMVESEIETTSKRKETKDKQLLDRPSANISTCDVSNDIPVLTEETSTSASTFVTPKSKTVTNVNSSQRGKKNSSIQKLTNQLAEIIHCNNPDDINILQKATSTITTLRQQACDLMSTYSQLKFQNDELIQKQNLLQSGQHVDDTEETQGKCPLIIEVLIPSAGSRKAFDSAPLYHHIAIEDCQIPTILEEDLSLSNNITEEPYKERYDAQMNFNPALEVSETYQCKNKKLPCKLGCVCSSLTSGKPPVQHCKSPICMLEPECTQPDNPSHIPNPVSTIINRRNLCGIDVVNPNDSDPASPATILIESRSNLPVSRSKRSAIKTKQKGVRKATKRVKTSLPRLDARKHFNDEKLNQECFVRLIKLDTTILNKKPVTSRDAKLESKCYVRLKRLQIQEKQSIFCMVHRVHQCPCLESPTTG